MFQFIQYFSVSSDRETAEFGKLGMSLHGTRQVRISEYPDCFTSTQCVFSHQRLL